MPTIQVDAPPKKGFLSDGDWKVYSCRVPKDGTYTVIDEETSPNRPTIHVFDPKEPSLDLGNPFLAQEKRTYSIELRADDGPTKYAVRVLSG